MKKFIICILIYLCLSGCKSENTIDLTPNTPVSNSSRIIVYVCGEIMYPGIYELDDSSLLIDLINKAGGVTKGAKLDNLNLAAVLNNNAMILIPSKTENDVGNSSLININTATLDELTTLTKVGKAKAQSIIDYRSENGFFQSIEELLNVPGIGEGIYNEIKDSITI